MFFLIKCSLVIVPVVQWFIAELDDYVMFVVCAFVVIALCSRCCCMQLYKDCMLVPMSVTPGMSCGRFICHIRVRPLVSCICNV